MQGFGKWLLQTILFLHLTYTVLDFIALTKVFLHLISLDFKIFLLRISLSLLFS